MQPTKNVLKNPSPCSSPTMSGLVFSDWLRGRKIRNILIASQPIEIVSAIIEIMTASRPNICQGKLFAVFKVNPGLVVLFIKGNIHTELNMLHIGVTEIYMTSLGDCKLAQARSNQHQKL